MVDCQTLAAQMQSIQAKLQHVRDDAARQELIARSEAIQAEQNRLGCLDSRIRRLGGLATIWTDSSGLPGPSSSPTSLNLRIYTRTGQVDWWFEPFSFGIATVELTQGYPTNGYFDESTGYLSLHAVLSIVNLPVVSSAQGDMYFSTDATITLPSGMRIGGQRVAASGHVILVGEGPFNTDLGSARAWVEIAGGLGAPE
jgi:hypothetical protein